MLSTLALRHLYDEEDDDQDGESVISVNESEDNFSLHDTSEDSEESFFRIDEP